MLRIGLTGGIGSGKSAVARCFVELGVPVVDTDEISRSLTQTGEPGYHAIVKLFGKDVLDRFGQIDRRRLRDRVFSDSDERKRLEAALHPLIRAEVQRQITGLRAPYCVIIVPLLFEAGFEKLVDRVLVIDVDESTQIKRVAERDEMSQESARAIIASQLPRQIRRNRADDLVTNETTLEALNASVRTLHQRYLALSQRLA